jgi:uncharacterized protein
MKLNHIISRANATVVLVLLAFAALVLAGCSGSGRAPAPATSTPVVIAQITNSLTVEDVAASATPVPAAPTATATRQPTATPQPTSTPTATPPPTETPAPTATPSPTPLDPLSIEAMRGQTYPGSDIKIEQTLKAGANYQRYVVSYLSDGLKIYGLLTVPNGKAPATGWPIIVFNHGYIPPDQYRTTERYVAYQDAFARAGYITLKSDYRGHGSSEGEARGGYGSPDYTDDVMNAMESLKRYPGADPNRIGMWGHSMGGQITLRAMVISKDVKAGVIWGGVVAPYTDMLTKWRRPSSAPPLNIPARQRRWRQDFYDKYGTPEQNPAFWASISPSEYVADISGPLQLQHASGDEEVPVQFSRDLYAKMKALGEPVEYYEYKGDNHNISGNLATALQRSVAFFDKYVKNAK